MLGTRLESAILAHRLRASCAVCRFPRHDAGQDRLFPRAPGTAGDTWRVLGTAPARQRCRGISPRWCSSAAGRLARIGRGPPTSSFSSVGFTSGSLGQVCQWPLKGAPLTCKLWKVKEAFKTAAEIIAHVSPGKGTEALCSPAGQGRTSFSSCSPGPPPARGPSLHEGRTNHLLQGWQTVCTGCQGRPRSPARDAAGSPHHGLLGLWRPLCGSPGLPALGGEGWGAAEPGQLLRHDLHRSCVRSQRSAQVPGQPRDHV